MEERIPTPMVEAARKGDAGALAASISGAGPTLFALCRSPRTGQAALEAMVSTFAAHGLAASGFVSGADNPGVRAL